MQFWLLRRANGGCHAPRSETAEMRKKNKGKCDKTPENDLIPRIGLKLGKTDYKPGEQTKRTNGSIFTHHKYPKDPAVLKTLRVVNHYHDSNSLPR